LILLLGSQVCEHKRTDPFYEAGSVKDQFAADWFNLLFRISQRQCDVASLLRSHSTVAMTPILFNRLNVSQGSDQAVIISIVRELIPAGQLHYRSISFRYWARRAQAA
jgi:hypothetical protein